jgi:hypothetical protein
MNYDSSIIDSHEQKDEFSCIPSAVEMVLKLLGKVATSYYDLQDRWGNKADGTFADFNGVTVAGVTFEQRFGSLRGEDFPYTRLFNTIDGELASGRYVIVSLVTPANRFHMHVIYDNKNDDYQEFTKSGKNTTHFLGSVKACTPKMKGTDILIYQA